MEILNYLDPVKTFSSSDSLPESLLISKGPMGLATFYAPFEYINKDAKLVICGITPGLQQAKAALSAASACLNTNQSVAASIKVAKSTGSFAGVMRTNLVSMLNHNI